MMYQQPGQLPSLPGSSIYGLPRKGSAIFQGPAARADEFCEALRQNLQAHVPGTCHFENIDVSKVQWDVLSFSALFDLLLEFGVSTQRLKAFKCSLDDEALHLIIAWLDSVPADKLPSEIHLSHNRITEAGFDSLLASLEVKRAELASKPPPIWLRVESTGVSDATIKHLAAEGKICHCPRIGDPKRFAAVDAIAAMPSFEPVTQATANASANVAAKPGGQWWNATPTASAGNARIIMPPGNAAARSRSPAPRVIAATTSAAAAGKLPYPWEEHFSEEYGIPYFWNSQTGASLWERPANGWP